LCRTKAARGVGAAGVALRFALDGSVTAGSGRSSWSTIIPVLAERTFATWCIRTVKAGLVATIRRPVIAAGRAWAVIIPTLRARTALVAGGVVASRCTGPVITGALGSWAFAARSIIPAGRAWFFLIAAFRPFGTRFLGTLLAGAFGARGLRRAAVGLAAKATAAVIRRLLHPGECA
jgi:hypothetical protein